jgi:DDE family transposase
MTSIARVSQAMQTVLTTVADTAARTSGFVQRASKLTGALFTQTLVLSFLADPDSTREDLAQTAAALGLQISPQAIDQRMTESAASLLLEVLDAAASTVLAADPIAIELFERFEGVYIQDSTLVALPSTLAHIWRGTGSKHVATENSARIKLSVRLNLSTGALHGPHTDHGLTSDRSLMLQSEPIPPGGLRIADLGFFALGVFKEIGQAGGYWLSRPRANTVVYAQDGTRIDLPSFLAAQETATVDLPILLGAQEQLPCRLLAVRVPQEVADQRRRRLREEARRRGRTPSVLQLALAEWTMFVTNAPCELMNVREALILGRCRWQIELLFKLWKSQGGIARWRSGKAGAILCELYAKVIAMIIQHWIVLTGCWGYAERSLTKASATVRRHAMCLATALKSECRLAEAIETIAMCVAVGCRINKSKKTPHTYQLLLDLTEAAFD